MPLGSLYQILLPVCLLSSDIQIPTVNGWLRVAAVKIEYMLDNAWLCLPCVLSMKMQMDAYGVSGFAYGPICTASLILLEQFTSRSLPVWHDADTVKANLDRQRTSLLIASGRQKPRLHIAKNILYIINSISIYLPSL